MAGLLRYTKCLCTKCKGIWMNDNRVMEQRSSRIFYYVMLENGLMGILLPTNILNGCHNLNVWIFSKLLTAVALSFIGVPT